ncbi:VWA domain-containing protein [Leptolyngbya sp. FACHB-261]|uniref:vWA domain-containing protein n=1 Tax=Leptolyngbya sp. FACHB-261 TaxID=2692806 RepID=UPI0016870540|nr:VWA domain-containing protein [Leptolyngbya sp. FACHB-261]MBD2104597.1 VWA domain-containing protein [Leptolyngbya sp. FACHB-261]
MSVNLRLSLSDANLDRNQASSQRQLAIYVSAGAERGKLSRTAPLNLCLLLDHSGSMAGQPLETVKQAAGQLIDQLAPQDRISVVAFDHQAEVLVPNQSVQDPSTVRARIQKLRSAGGTCIDCGIKAALEQLAQGKQGTISQAFVLTDGENEHGDNDRCVKLARLATEYNFTLHTLGFGDSWNQDVLESIADAGGGAMAYIREPDQAVLEFERLFQRIQDVGLTNAYLVLRLGAGVRLAELKPVAQVAPDVIELPVQAEGNFLSVRLGDLMTDTERVVLINLYITQPAMVTAATWPVAQVQVRYDNPATQQLSVLTDPVSAEVQFVADFRPNTDPTLAPHIMALAKYRQTQMAEAKLQQGDTSGAATLLQAAAKTALQMGDQGAATVLQNSATRLQSGEALSESERKQTRIVSKTVLQPPS